MVVPNVGHEGLESEGKDCEKEIDTDINDSFNYGDDRMLTGTKRR